MIKQVFNSVNVLEDVIFNPEYNFVNYANILTYEISRIDKDLFI